MKIEQKLKLNKTTISKLNDETANQIKGGEPLDDATNFVNEQLAAALTGTAFLCGSSLAGGPICICGYSVKPGYCGITQ